jgi:WD40 repeat protein
MGNKSSKNAEHKKIKEKECLLQTCDDHGANGINCMEISEDGSVLATGSDDGLIKLWSAKTQIIECISTLEGHEDYITMLLIEDQYLISASADTTIRKWDMSSGTCILAFLGHEATVNKIVSVGDFIFSVAYDKKARCWDADTGECVRVFSGHKNNVTSLLFIPCEKENLNDAIQFVQQAAVDRNMSGLNF